MGLSTAWALVQDGCDVTVLEQFDVGNTNGSSHGASRVYRTFYDRIEYAKMALAALPLWRELEDASGTALLEVTGSIETLEGSDGDRRTLDALSIPYEIMGPEQARARFPDVRLPGDILYQADSAVIAADDTVTALRGLLGNRVHEQRRVMHIDDIDADVVVLCCGSFGAELLGPLGVDLPLFPTLETIAYFRPRSGSLGAQPVINDLSREQRYGLPTASLGLYKFSEHGTGPRIDPRTADRTPDPDAVARLTRSAVDYLPGFEPDPVAVETCVYENTPDRDFVIDRRGRIVVACGFSGHGFKFAPLVGRICADLAADRDPGFDLSLFRLDRDSLRSDELAPPR